ncbi:MAG: hypothetical protein KatS3mg109_2363 [Pirellulaceae bacterium]|nr:MAG: hypothetical protein KatS3mg109_2363 [Pirellulaceae bacterium]
MQRRMISYSMMICGIVAMMIGFTLLPLPTSSTAAPALQPSPRPTIPPVTVLPYSEPTPVPMGRITGTIIDLRTHAPTPNIAVQIGDAVVYSDANGNYDRWVESGYYTVTLQLRDDQGSPGQPPLNIAVGPGDTVVAHLFFTSPAPNESSAPITIEAPTTEPISEPVAVIPALPEVIPPKLPYTGVADTPATTIDRQPTFLPRTATTIPFNAQFWFVVGFILLAGGLGLQFWPVRRNASSAAHERILAELLSTPPPPLHHHDDELLYTLLTQHDAHDKR